MKMSNYTNIDEYITNYPDETQDILQKIRRTVAEVAPEAIEKISYGIPTFELNGKNLVHFAGYDNFVSFYPGAEPIQAYANQLTDYKTSKGTIQFPLGRPIPYDLIKEITVFCIKKRD